MKPKLSKFVPPLIIIFAYVVLAAVWAFLFRKKQTAVTKIPLFNSLGPPIDVYMRRRNNPSLVPMIACRLVGTKPLFEPMLEYSSFET